MKNLFRQGISMLIGGLLVAAILIATRASAQDTPTTIVEPAGGEEAAVPVAPVMSYQGQLLDPFTGAPKPNGLYALTFSIYNVGTGGAPLWTESKSVATTDGLFSAFLGDITPLDLSIFSGQVLWLGIKVGTDQESVPRQRLAYAPFALYAATADTLDGLDSSAFVRSDQGGGRGALAYGFVDTNGDRISGTNNWDSELVDEGSDRRGYYIRIDNEDYYYRDYATVVTAACNFPRIPNTGSDNGRLLVEFFAPDGDRETCRFHFVVYKP